MPTDKRITLDTLRKCRQTGNKFAMLTAYDYPTARLAQQAGVHSLLVGDSMGTVLLGHPSTRYVPFDLMLTLSEAVRRGAPDVYLVGDMPYESKAAGYDQALTDAKRYRDEAGCDAVKFEAASEDHQLVAQLTAAGIETIAHLGLRPQEVTTPDGYRAQARDHAGIETLVTDARHMADAGAAMLLLEAVPAEAGQAVHDAVNVPIIGCGAGPVCDGHVLVTQDMLGMGFTRTPRFVPVLANVNEVCAAAMRKYVTDIVAGRYPGPEHTYRMRNGSETATGA